MFQEVQEDLRNMLKLNTGAENQCGFVLFYLINIFQLQFDQI